MRKEYKPYVGREDTFQESVAQFLNLKNILWCHPANERRTEIRVKKDGTRYSPEGSKLKAKGLKPGLPDILIFTPNKLYVGLAIELKVGKNTTTPEQKIWLGSLEEAGWQVLVSYSLDEVIDLVNEYLSNK